MSKIQLATRTVGKFVGDNSPTILSGIAVAGVVFTTVLTVYSTRSALEELEIDDSTRHGRFLFVKRTPIDTFKLTWKYYIPPALVGAATIACVIGANSIGNRRQAALVTAFSLADKAQHQYREKVVEALGEAKEKGIRETLAVENMNQTELKSSEILETGQGDQICFDGWSGRYFRSNAERIAQAENRLNAQVINDMYASLNDFYDQLDLPRLPMGDEIGWNTEHLLSITYGHGLTPEKVPLLAMQYGTEPIRNFHKVW